MKELFNPGGQAVDRPPIMVWLPALLVAAAVVLPLGYLILRAVGAGGEVWWLLLRVRTLQVLGRTIALITGVTVVSVALSVPLAWLLTRTDLPFRRIWSVLTALPLVIPSYVAGLVVVSALGPRGMLQQLLAGPLRVERLPEIYGFPGAMLAIVLVSYPLVLISLQSTLRGLDPAQEEASRSMGHGQWRTFFGVVLPQLRPALGAGALLVALYTLSDFGAVSLLRYETFTWAIFLQYQTAFERSLAAGLSLVLVAVAFVILFVEARTRGRAVYHDTTARVRRPPSVVRLGGWRWFGLVACSIVVLIVLMIPMSILVYWLVQGFSRGEPLRLLLGSALNSLYASFLAAVATTSCALPLAILSARYSGRIGRLLEPAAFTGYALPGIVVALALVFFAARFATPFYQSLGLLILAYVILFLPQALGAEKSSLLQVNPHLEEAARSLGRSRGRALLTITIPLIRNGLLAGAALVFFTTMKELPATLILSPTGFKTLATSIWSATSEAFFARAAAPALFLILVSAAPVAFLTLREPR